SCSSRASLPWLRLFHPVMRTWFPDQREAVAQCTNHLENGAEAGIPFFGECLVESFARQARFTRKFAHVPRPGAHAQRMGDEAGIVTPVFQASLQIGFAILFVFKVLRRIPAGGFEGHHS